MDQIKNGNYSSNKVTFFAYNSHNCLFNADMISQ